MAATHLQEPARPLAKMVIEEADGTLVVDERPQPFAPNAPKPAMFFEPIVFTNVDSPNEKLVLSERSIRKTDNKLQIRRLPTIKFLNSKFVARTREEADRIRKVCPSCYEEPGEEERKGMQEYTLEDDQGRRVFSTYNYDGYKRFQKIYRRYAG